MTTPAVTKYFKTFAAHAYPVEPREELRLEEALLLTTYYEARYDAANRLREFIKRLRERDAENKLSWAMMFIERYEYWPSGRLKTRRLVGRDGAARSWNFEDSPFKWTAAASSPPMPNSGA